MEKELTLEEELLTFLSKKELEEFQEKGRFEKIAEGKYILIIGEVADSVLEPFRKEYKNRIFAIEVRGELIKPNVQEVLVGYFKKPDRIAIGRAMGYVNVNQTIEAGESLLDDTWLIGAIRLKSIAYEDTDYRIAVAHQLYLRTTVFEAGIKNV
jgi:hypothetical protein